MMRGGAPVMAGTIKRQWEGHSQSVFDLRFRPDGKILASASRGGEIRLWEASGGRFLAALEGNKSMVFALSFAPDGRALVSGGTAADGAKVWELNYYDRHIAGNLEYQIGRMAAGTTDETAVARMRAWAAEAAGRPAGAGAEKIGAERAVRSGLAPPGETAIER